MNVLCMQPSEPRLYHVWPGRETDAGNMHGLVESWIQWVDLCMYRTFIVASFQGSPLVPMKYYKMEWESLVPIRR